MVALSTTEPDTIMPFNRQVNINPPLPRYFQSNGVWIKGDMVYSVGFHRLDLIRTGKDQSGKRQYYYKPLNQEQIKGFVYLTYPLLNIVVSPSYPPAHVLPDNALSAYCYSADKRPSCHALKTTDGAGEAWFM